MSGIPAVESNTDARDRSVSAAIALVPLLTSSACQTPAPMVQGLVLARGTPEETGGTAERVAVGVVAASPAKPTWIEPSSDEEPIGKSSSLISWTLLSSRREGAAAETGVTVAEATEEGATGVPPPMGVGACVEASRSAESLSSVGRFTSLVALRCFAPPRPSAARAAATPEPPACSEVEEGEVREPKIGGSGPCGLEGFGNNPKGASMDPDTAGGEPVCTEPAAPMPTLAGSNATAGTVEAATAAQLPLPQPPGAVAVGVAVLQLLGDVGTRAEGAVDDESSCSAVAPAVLLALPNEALCNGVGGAAGNSPVLLSRPRPLPEEAVGPPLAAAVGDSEPSGGSRMWGPLAPGSLVPSKSLSEDATTAAARVAGPLVAAALGPPIAGAELDEASGANGGGGCGGASLPPTASGEEVAAAAAALAGAVATAVVCASTSSLLAVASARSFLGAEAGFPPTLSSEEDF